MEKVLYYWWIPVGLIINIIYAICSCMYNRNGGIYGIILYMIPLIPLWLYISRHTKQMITDAFIFDIVIIVGFLIGNVLMGELKEFTNINKIGIIVTLIGLTLMKLPKVFVKN